MTTQRPLSLGTVCEIVGLQREVRWRHLGGWLDDLNEEAERVRRVVVGGCAVSGGSERADAGDRRMAGRFHLDSRLR